MSNKFNPAYTLLHFQVIALTLRGYVENTYIDDLPETNRAIDWRLEKVQRLDDKYPIPINFHLVNSDLESGVFGYELVLTFENTPYRLILSEVVRDSILCIWPFKIKPQGLRVCWVLLSRERMSKYQIESVVRQYGEVYHPYGFPTLLDYELVGVWKG